MLDARGITQGATEKASPLQIVAKANAEGTYTYLHIPTHTYLHIPVYIPLHTYTVYTSTCILDTVYSLYGHDLYGRFCTHCAGLEQKSVTCLSCRLKQVKPGPSCVCQPADDQKHHTLCK